jgi:hypothetical protein
MMPFADLAGMCAEQAQERVNHAIGLFPDCWNPAAPVVKVFDDVLLEPLAYREYVLEQTFGSVVVGPAVFHGLAELPMDPVRDALVNLLPACEPTLTFARLSPEGQAEPNYIHTDTDMGQWTGILYLNPKPAQGDGTLFWRHRMTGATQVQARTAEEAQAEGLAWRDDRQWDRWSYVEARFNRLVWFEAPAFHSRAIPDNYGHGLDARLIQVMFGRFKDGAACV